ncbi:Vitamin K-dependent protein Z [Varanus komodoensis]|nr:Vitamin K-dependent protein Z [Varanus komodoensis]
MYSSLFSVSYSLKQGETQDILNVSFSKGRGENLGSSIEAVAKSHKELLLLQDHLSWPQNTPSVSSLPTKDQVPELSTVLSAPAARRKETGGPVPSSKARIPPLTLNQGTQNILQPWMLSKNIKSKPLLQEAPIQVWLQQRLQSKERTVSKRKVFLSAREANDVIARSKRAGTIILEEILPGNLERECLEERCSYEEAREAFEDTPKTQSLVELEAHSFLRPLQHESVTSSGEAIMLQMSPCEGGMGKPFGSKDKLAPEKATCQPWAGPQSQVGKKGVQCSSSPCMNNGTCRDNIRSYICDCKEGFQGRNCNFGRNECRHELNEGCQHFCYPGLTSYDCSCAKGYKLGENNTACIPQDHCACGRLEDHVTAPLNASEKGRGGFPWQVLLLNADGNLICGGVLLETNFVLTTAECGWLSPRIAVIGIDRIFFCNDLHNVVHLKQKLNEYIITYPGNGMLQSARQEILVTKVNLHPRHDHITAENNLALLKLQKHIDCNSHHLPICIPERDFAEHVLMSKLTGTLSGWKRGATQSTDAVVEQPVFYLNENECQRKLNRSLITREFCAHTWGAAEEPLTEGSFSAVNYKGTWFLTGILEPWATAVSQWKTLIFTKTSRYMMWFQQIKNLQKNLPKTVANE